MALTQHPESYLSLRLKWLDVLLHREILRLRATYQLSLDEFRGLYISDDQVNAFIDQTLGFEGNSSAIEELTQRAAALRSERSSEALDDRSWQHLVVEFSLTPIEEDILVLALAPELDLKYETLYAYLNNDVTRKWPTNDLALRILAVDNEQRRNVRKCLTGEATLFTSGLLQAVTQIPERPSWRSVVSVPPSVLHYLSGSEQSEIPEAPAAWDAIPISPTLRAVLQRIPRVEYCNDAAPLFVFSGREGSGRALAAEAICDELAVDLVRVDLAALRAATESFETLLQRVLMQKRLRHTGLYLERPESFFDQQGQVLPDARKVIKLLTHRMPPIFIASEPETRLQELLTGQRAVTIQFDEPGYELRLQLWEKGLAGTGVSTGGSELSALADSFVLSPGQITAAVNAARDEQVLRNDDAPAVTSESLFAAAREQSNQSLGSLAVKMRTIHSWRDLVLPRATLQRLKEIAASIKHRHIVYSDWGFERRIAAGLGLKILFAGASGTGKTMAAGVIARELGLDVYKIDLSAIVSKYIGETEKNLDRIFRAAQSSNAILFFDEADALFGKRSEVKDAHDRYANIEVAYLLQKIEEYHGVVILASNLSKNIDEAFSRRMHCVVEFPLPDERHREQLWLGMFPPEVPLGPDVDFKFLAKQFAIAGGDIRNVALDAAFMAAQDGRVVTMKQLVKAMARQLTKKGQVPSPSEFKHYHELISQSE